jgi:hypothetical protein
MLKKNCESKIVPLTVSFHRDLKGSEGENLFKLCTCDLALDTSAFSELLGAMAEDGTRIGGLIDAFFTSSVSYSDLILYVLIFADSGGIECILESKEFLI